MNHNFSNEVLNMNSQPNTNNTQLQNSAKCCPNDYNNSDNFWAVDPFLLSEPYRSTTEESGIRDISDSLIINNQLLTEIDNQNFSLNSSHLCNNQDEISFNPSTSMIKDSHECKTLSKKINKKIYRKLPIHFIDTKDWQSYMELATIRNSTTSNNLTLGLISNGMPKPGKFKNNKVHRLLNSIYNLYQEYTEMSDEYEKLYSEQSNKYLSTDSVSSDEVGGMSKDPCLVLAKKKKRKKFQHKPFPINMPETPLQIYNNIDRISTQNSNHDSTDASCQTIPLLEWSEMTDEQLTDLASYPEGFNSSSKKWNISSGINSKRNNSSTLSENYVSGYKAKRIKICDHLTRQNFLGEQAIDIMEELSNNRPTLSHKMNLVVSANNSQGTRNSPDEAPSNDYVNHPNFIFNSIATALRCATSKTGTNGNASNSTLINLPIIMDLMLPKIQTKIRQIFEECPFLNNPLEIMAELRYFNYNKNATIEYFKTTRQLRGSIKEFINSHIDSRCRMVILRCLYRNYHYPNDKDGDNKQLLACSNCGKEITSKENQQTKCPLSDKEFFISPEDELNFFKLSDTNSDCFYPIQMAACEAEKATVDMYSKATFTEVVNLGKLVQDDFSQTKCVDTKIVSENIRRLAESIGRNVLYLKQSIKESKIQMSHLRRQVSSLLKALKNNIDLIISLSSKHFMSDQHRNRILLLARQVEELKIKLKEEETKRRLVYNLMQEQMGNVRVYCRCRDIPHNENVLEIQGNESIVLPILPQERFDFDKVFPSNMSQSDIYEEFRPLVMSFIDGFNVCFITYGSEASGKTYTLIGGNVESKDDHGIMQRALNTLLTEQHLRNRDWDYQITACLVEIYNDNCIDILSGESGIQLYVDCGMESVYQKLKSVPITNETDTEVLLQLCRVKRKIAKTALNPASSRSHLITLIRLQGKSKIHGENIRSFMCLCDLAGFEDIIKAETQSNKTLSKEAGYINKSLTAFNRVFVSLRRQDPNTVCYRDTKLTHILKPFLTNSGKCALVITIRTDRRSLSSTQNTLRFGRETRGVSLGKARRQVNLNQQ